MAKIPISYKAYDNGYKIPMGVCLTVGGSALLSGLFSDEIGVFVLGIIFIVLFFVFKYLNYAKAKEEAEKSINDRVNFFKTEVDSVLRDEKLTDDEKISEIIELSKDGNEYARLFLVELAKQIDG